MTDYQTILTEKHQKVALITLNRPQSYNALNLQLLDELMSALQAFDQEKEIGAMVITGNTKAFAAGADISSMVDASPQDLIESAFIPAFNLIREIKKPIIAAVAGFCLGGGLELAMSCDFIVAAENSKFGQPEINLGIIPGAGGTQRLTRLVGKGIAMEMILNNRTIKAQEARDLKLVNHVFETEEYLSLTMSLAEEIANRAPLAIIAAKRAVNQAFELNLTEGLDQERDLFYDLFNSQDQKEGMKAFLEKREPLWKGA
jgi:enoyl-CoA hydratase